MASDNKGLAEPAPALAAAPTVAATPEARSTSTPFVVAQENNTEPSPPTKGPEESPPVAEQDVASAETDADVEPSATPDVPAKTPPRVATNKQKSSTSSPRTRGTQVPPDEFSPGSTIRSGSFPARYVGTTSDGRLIFRLPNGELKYMRPRYHRFRYYPIERRAPVFEPPNQPFD